MKIKYWMTPSPLITIGPKAPIAEAARLMKERSIHRLPVMEDNRLVGLITYRDILEAQPSPATSLSVHEIRYLSAQILVRDIMNKHPLTVRPDDQIIPALLLARKHDLSSFPVMDGDRLAGIITSSDLFNLFLDILGRDLEKCLIGLEEEGPATPLGPLPRIIHVLSRADIAVKTFLALPLKSSSTQNRFFIKVDASQAEAASRLLAQAGFKPVFQD